MRFAIYLSLFVVLNAGAVQAQDTPSEADYYPITEFEIPEGVVLEAGGFQLMPDGKMAVCSRRTLIAASSRRSVLTAKRPR